MFAAGRHENFDWLGLDEILPPVWIKAAEDDDGTTYEIDRSSCFVLGDTYWWKQRVGISGKRFDYLLMAASTRRRRLLLVARRILGDPPGKPLAPEATNIGGIDHGRNPQFDSCLSLAERWAALNGFSVPPPFVLFGVGVLTQ